MATTAETVHFFGPCVRLELGESQGRCWLRMVVERGVDGSAAEVRLQISYQPRDSRGLASGAARVVFEDVWQLDVDDHGPGASVEGWLPEGLRLDFIRQCHVKVAFCSAKAA